MLEDSVKSVGAKKRFGSVDIGICEIGLFNRIFVNELVLLDGIGFDIKG